MFIAAGAAVNQATDNGSTPLFIACYKGHTEIAAALIAAGAKVNQATDNGAGAAQPAQKTTTRKPPKKRKN